ncbi:Tc toxin subunit A [Bacillus cereus]|uniref:Tc toxin subunit A n=1 Tax=Bacillus cereus TaxID=1396 RepID=UPI0020D26800|nr:Tc toxin subunit A [Bacillus cereus]
MSKTDDTNIIFQFGTDKLTEALHQSGYRTVFDITSESLSEFEENNPEIPSSDAKEVYKLAVQRTENLLMLSKAWQLHNDPVVKGIPKLSSNIGMEGMRSALKRSLGGGANFEDLFPERSPEGYAQSASIQSLFSPGRYLTVLYKIARQLHESTDKLQIDNRRPDLKSLILSEDSMNKEVSSLDILLNVLQPNGTSTLQSLKDTYYPMTLPYDDDLMKINAVVKSHSTDLLGIWDILLDNQRCILLQEPKFNGIYKIKTALASASGIDVGVSLDTKGNRSVHLYTDNSTKRHQWNFYYDRNRNAYQIYNLANAKEVLTWNDFSGSNYVVATNNEYKEGQYWILENVGNDYYIIKNKKHPNLVLNVEGGRVNNYTKIQVHERNGTNEQKFKLKPVSTVYQSNLKKNETGDKVIPKSKEIKSIVYTTPSPKTRETLSLTPNSFQLLVNPNPTIEDIASHYNVKDTENLNSTDLIAILNDVDKFCMKTGLSFNKLIELTMQKDYQSKSSEYKSRFVKFGSTENVPVSKYGAVFLTGTEETPLWIKKYDSANNATDTPVLNFTENNLVALAGRAEKLVRLANCTNLSFEQLDWLIINASKSVIEHGNQIILDTPVLGALAEFKRLNKRYSIKSDMFATFIGEMNTYAETDKKSFYQDTFSNADGITIPLGASLQFEIDKQGLYESICCGGLGVTADEFSRIGTYCFGNETKQITVDEVSMAQLYRLGKIPQLLGLSFGEAELLWKTIASGKDTLLRIIGSNPYNLQNLDIIYQTEVLLDWMNTYQFDVVSLQVMITNQYSCTATPELYNFLKKVYESIISVGRTSRTSDHNDMLAEKMSRALGAAFNLKANVMRKVMKWMDKANPMFMAQDFSTKLHWYFSTDHEDELTTLEKHPELLKWCQQISQYVLIVRWFSLTEQEMEIMLERTEWLLDAANPGPMPSLHLLLVLSRLKEWEQRIQVSSDEALRYFAQINSNNIKPDVAVKLLAHIHGWNKDDTVAVNNYLFGDDAYPTNFEQIFTLESWVNLGKQLNVGSRTLGELVELIKEDETAENTNLITSVAQSLMTSVQPGIDLTKTGGK